MFTRSDAAWLSATIGAFYGARTMAELAAATREAFDREFRLHSFAFEELGMTTSSYRCHELRCGTSPPADYLAYFHDNPFCWAVGASAAPPVLQMRRDVPRAQWERTDHFNGIARSMGWNDQMVIVARSRPTFVSIGLHRDTRFSHREYHLAYLLQAHLNAAWKRVQPETGLALHSGPLEVPLSDELRPVHLTAGQCDILRAYFPRWRARAELPSELRAWVVQSREKMHRQPPPHPLYAFTVESARGRLLVRCFFGPNSGVGLRMVETPANPNFLELRTRGLTPRECEVLHWIAQGKRDAEIAAIIGTAARTVSKHVEHVLRKLHSESRGAAVRAAREFLSS